MSNLAADTIDELVDSPPIVRRIQFPLLVFITTQLLIAASMLFIAAREGQTYLEFVSRWDGGYYLEIARHGYTRDILINGTPVDRNWAYYPLYPLTVGIFAALTRLDAATVAPIVSLTAAAAGVVILHSMIASSIGARIAKVTTVLVCTAVAAPVFQMAYTEGVALLLLVLAFDSLLRRRHAALFLILPLLALCRPVELPFAAVIAVHLLARWNRTPTSERVTLTLLALYSVAVSGLWPLLAGLVTGVPNIYLRTMDMWAQPNAGRTWFLQALQYPVGWVVIALAIALPIWIAMRFMPDRTPLEFQVWMAVYPIFVLFTAYPASSTIRYFVLLFPVALMPATSARSNWLIWGIAAVGVVTQSLWIQLLVASSSRLFP